MKWQKESKVLDTLLSVITKKYRVPIEEMMTFLFVLRAWKRLGEEGVIEEEALKFKTFHSTTLDAKKMVATFKKLENTHKLFRLSTRFIPNIPSSPNELLQMLTNMAKEEEKIVLPRVNTFFYDNTKAGAGSIGSDQVAELAVKLLKQTEELYVPCTYGFSYAYHTDSMIYAENINPKSEFVAELMNILEGTHIQFRLSNALENPSFTEENASHILKEFDAVLTFPPMGLKKNLDLKLDKYNRYRFHKGSQLDVAYLEHILAQTKNKAVIRMPVGFAYRSGNEQKMRKYLVENNLLEAVIHLPPNIYHHTSIESILLIINKHKDDPKVKFLNLNHASLLKKAGRRTVLKNIEGIVNIYNYPGENIDGIPAISTREEPNKIKENDYSLAINRYLSADDVAEINQRIDDRYGSNVDVLYDVAVIKKSQLFKDEEEGKEVYEISPSEFVAAGYVTQATKKKYIGTKQKKKLENYKLHPNDILLSTKGTIGKVAIMGETDIPMIASQAIHIVRPQNLQEAIVLYMYFKSNAVQTLLKHLVSGSSMPQISTRDLEHLPVPSFSEGEEREIHESFKEEQEIDGKIQKLKKQKEAIHNRILGEEES